MRFYTSGEVAKLIGLKDRSWVRKTLDEHNLEYLLFKKQIRVPEDSVHKLLEKITINGQKAEENNK